MKDIIRIIMRATGLVGLNAYLNNAICIIQNIGRRASYAIVHVLLQCLMLQPAD